MTHDEDILDLLEILDIPGIHTGSFAPRDIDIYCENCPYLNRCEDYEEFWGDRSVPRLTFNCEFGAENPEDDACPWHDDWLELEELEEEDFEDERDEEFFLI